MRFSPRAQAAAVLLGAGSLGVLLAFHPPVEGSFLPPCPLHATTGLHCPGCGSTRALAALVRGDLALAWRNNPLAMLALLALVPWGIRQGWLALRENRFASFSLPKFGGQAIVWTVILFTVLRNLPWAPFCWLAPVE